MEAEHGVMLLDVRNMQSIESDVYLMAGDDAAQSSAVLNMQEYEENVLSIVTKIQSKIDPTLHFTETG